MIFYILNSNSEIVETIQSPNQVGSGGITATEGIVDEKLDTYELLTIKVPADSDGLEKISEEMNIAFEDISGWREYTIYEIEDEDGSNFYTTIRAELSSSELIDEIIEEDLSGVSRDPKTVLESLLDGTRYSAGHVDSSVYSQTFNVNTQYMNVLEALNEYAKNYGAEIRFSYQVNENKVINRFVNIYKTYGEYKGKIFEIDRDMTSVKRTVNTELIKTTIIPYSKELEVDPEDSENKETYRIGIENIEWKKSNGDPVDKPLGQNYLVDPVALERWGKLDSDGTRRHRKISMEFDSDNAESIMSMAWVQLGRYTQPRVSYEVSAIDLYALTGDEDLKHEEILLGDTGGVKDHYFAKPIEIQTRAVEITRDLFDPRNNDYIFGNAKQIFSVNEGVEKSEDMAKDLEELIKVVGDFQVSVDGTTKIFRGSNAPVEPNENDLWFRPHPSKQGHTQMMLFNGVSWEIRADSSDLEDAGRLSFGTIDGANINVINLIADNITGGQLKLENGIEITNKGVPILKVNGAGEVELNISKLNLRAMDMESELDKLAKKEELEELARKEELDELARREELDELARKEELDELARKEELDELARKEDLNKVITQIITEYNISSSASTAPTSGWSTNAPTWKDGQYIWSRTTTVYKDGTQDNSEAVNISGASGESGSGTDGRSISEIKEEYYHSTSATTLTGGSWSTTVPTWASNKYIWSRTTIVYANPSGTQQTKPVNISGGQGPQGPQGATGSQGPRGATGTSVESVTEYYLATSASSGIKSSNSGFTTTMQPMTATKKYLWNYEKINFSDGTSQPTIPVIIGVYGDKGDTGGTGATGRSIVSITEHYLVTSASSGVTRSTSGWKTTMKPTTETNKYLWNYETIKWSSGTLTTYVEPIIIGVHGAKGPQGATGPKGATGSQGPRGAQGPQGIRGPAGANGQSQYLHVRYSNNANGNPMYAVPNANTKYVGIAVTSLSSAPGYTGFTWSKYVGDNGARGPQGVQGPKGTDGKPTYTWVKYADTPASGMSDYPEGKKYIGLAFNKTTATESTSYSAYQWSLMPQNLRVGGRNLLRQSNVPYENTGYPVATYELTEPIPNNTEVTLSIKGNLGRQRFGIYNSGGSVNMTSIYPADKKNGVYEKTFKWKIGTSSNVRIYVYPMPNGTGTATTIEWVKLEYGNIATDWTEAPEEIQEKIDEKAGTNVTDSISSELSDWITATATTEELGEINSKMKDYMEALEADKTNLEEAKKDISDLLTRTPLIEREMGEFADQWNFLDTYIKMTDEGLLIQETNGSTGIRVSAGRIDFLPFDSQGNPVAYITNQVMKINRAIFVESMQVGEHKIQTVSSGHTIWQWMR